MMKRHYLPSAIRDKYGKPLLSWRVAILPFVEQQSLYQQFHLDEPWDSEHNRELIKQMPEWFRDPHDDPKSTNASYFMPTGKGMIGESEEGIGDRQIKDGTSHTILLVEAKRDIPWTKPEDIEIDSDPGKPLPKFGGHLVPDGLFVAGFADGSVRTLSQSMDPQILHALFTIHGREIIDDSVLEKPYANAVWN